MAASRGVAIDVAFVVAMAVHDVVRQVLCVGVSDIVALAEISCFYLVLLFAFVKNKSSTLQPYRAFWRSSVACNANSGSTVNIERRRRCLMHAAFLQKPSHWHDGMQHSGGGDNLTAMTVRRGKMLALADVENAGTSKHKRSACDAFGNKSSVNKRMQTVLFSTSSKRRDCWISEQKRFAFLATKDQWLVVGNKMH